MARKSSIVASDPLADISPLTKSMIAGLLQQNRAQPTAPAPTRKSEIRLQLADPNSTDLGTLDEQPKNGKRREAKTLQKSILNLLNGPDSSIERLAFETDPEQNNTYASVYKTKLRLLPDSVLKRISIQDDLVAAIVNTRAAQIQAFGRPQPDRYSTGFKIVPDEAIVDRLSQDEKADLDKRVSEAEKKLATCGHTRGWKDKDRLTFAQFLGMSARNAVTVGRMATEVVYVETPDGKRKFHSFRPIDAGTIYRAAPQKEAQQAVRESALKMLADLKNEDLEPERFEADEYAWVQVIEGRPVQAFTEDECVVHNFYPVSDVELDGYPVTPLDTVISAVTTHINITTHNKLYFQSGRAARGMLIIKSDDVGEDVVRTIKHQFQASINNVNNAWRMPVFAVGAEDEIAWQAIDSGARDMEFQYLSDTNARVIMSAFQISPEELPGYQHLSRGTNNQALAESNNEWKMQAARDVGIRPLIAQFEDFLNQRILPLIDDKLAEVCVIKFVGLDAETPEKESVRIQQDMGIHMTYDEVLSRVEKKPVGLKMGGQIPLNAMYLQNLDKYFTVGQILEFFCGVKDASKDPKWAYCRDPFFFQNVEMQMQQQQMQMQQQQAQQQAAMGGPPPDDGGGGGDGGEGGPPPEGGGEEGGNVVPPQGPQQGEHSQPSEDGGEGEAPDMGNAIDQVIGMLGKSEEQLPRARRRILAHQKKTVSAFLDHFEADMARLHGTITDIASKFHKE